MVTQDQHTGIYTSKPTEARKDLQIGKNIDVTIR
jgi:hypothetical protein